MGGKLLKRIVGNREKIIEIGKKHGITNIRLFGSVSRKQEDSKSDIDFLVDVVTKPDGTRGNYIDFAVEVKAEIFRGRGVDVCTTATLHPRFKDKVMANCISIMEEGFETGIDENQVDERDYIVNVEKALDFIKEYWEQVSIGKDKWISDKKTRGYSMKATQNAVEEIVRTIPNKIKFKIKDIDWHGLREFRNFIVHNYDNVEWETMWDTAQRNIKETERACQRILEVLDEVLEEDKKKIEKRERRKQTKKEKELKEKEKKKQRP